ncbi:MAG: hypothetical protein ACPG5Z_01340 [Pseudoalteromonas sp.]
MTNRLLNVLLVCFFSVFAFTVNASDISTEVAEAKQRVELIKTRLDLTDKQEELVTPILESSISNRKAILNEYGIGLDSYEVKSGEKLGFRKVLELKNAMEELREQTLTKLESVLTDEQLAEYEDIQEEIASKIRSRIRAAR